MLIFHFVPIFQCPERVFFSTVLSLELMMPVLWFDFSTTMWNI